MGPPILSDTPDSDVVEVAEALMRYFANHPRAVDGVEGIVHWWLARQRFEDSWVRVEAALEYLVERGLAEKGTNADGKTVYWSSGDRPRKDGN